MKGLISILIARLRDKNGQATAEYAITAGMLILALLVLAVFLYTFKEHSGRVLDLTASEYP